MEEIEFLRFTLRELYNMIDVIEKRIGVLKKKKGVTQEEPKSPISLI